MNQLDQGAPVFYKFLNEVQWLSLWIFKKQHGNRARRPTVSLYLCSYYGIVVHTHGAVFSGSIKDMKRTKNSSVSRILFVEDMFVFSKGVILSAKGLMALLEKLQLNTGL